MKINGDLKVFRQDLLQHFYAGIKKHHLNKFYSIQMVFVNSVFNGLFQWPLMKTAII